MHWIFQCMVGHEHGIYLRSIRCTTRIPRSSSHIGINPSNPSNLLLEQCEIMIVNIYEGNVFGKINSPPSCSLFCSFSCQAFALCSIYCLTSIFLVEMSLLKLNISISTMLSPCANLSSKNYCILSLG